MAINTGFGHNKKLTNLPKIAHIVVNALKSELIQIMVLPNMDDFPIPKLKGMATGIVIVVVWLLPLLLLLTSGATPTTTTSTGATAAATS